MAAHSVGACGLVWLVPRCSQLGSFAQSLTHSYTSSGWPLRLCIRLSISTARKRWQETSVRECLFLHQIATTIPRLLSPRTTITTTPPPLLPVLLLLLSTTHSHHCPRPHLVLVGRARSTVLAVVTGPHRLVSVTVACAAGLIVTLCEVCGRSASLGCSTALLALGPLIGAGHVRPRTGLRRHLSQHLRAVQRLVAQLSLAARDTATTPAANHERTA